MAAVTRCNDFEPKKIESLSLFPLFPHLFAMKWWDWMPWSLFSECWVLSQLFTLLFHLHQEALYERASSLLSAIRVVSSAYLRLLIFLLAILSPACESYSPAFGMLYSACKLNKWGWLYTALTYSFPKMNQSVDPCPVFTWCEVKWKLLSHVWLVATPWTI